MPIWAATGAAPGVTPGMQSPSLQDGDGLPVGAPRFELGTSRTRTVRSTGLSHAPNAAGIILLNKEAVKPEWSGLQQDLLAVDVGLATEPVVGLREIEAGRRRCGDLEGHCRVKGLPIRARRREHAQPLILPVGCH